MYMYIYEKNKKKKLTSEVLNTYGVGANSFNREENANEFIRVSNQETLLNTGLVSECKNTILIGHLMTA